MADYIPITEAQSDPEAAVDSSLIKRLRDNPIAIAEGAAGAPKIADFGFRGQGTTFTITDLDEFLGLIVFFRGRRYRVQYSTDNGETFSNIFTISPLDDEIIQDYAFYDFSSGLYLSAGFGSVTLTGSSPSVNAVSFTNPFAGGSQNRYLVLAQGGNAAI